MAEFYLYNNSGDEELFSDLDVDYGGTIEITQDGVLTTYNEWTYEGNKKFVGLSENPNATEADYPIGSSVRIYSDTSLFIVEEAVQISGGSLTTITYNGNTIASLSAGQTATLPCSGKIMQGDVVVTAGSGGSGGGTSGFHIKNPLLGGVVSVDTDVRDDSATYQYELSRPATKVTLDIMSPKSGIVKTSSSDEQAVVYNDEYGYHTTVSCTVGGLVTVSNYSADRPPKESPCTIRVTFQDGAGNTSADVFWAYAYGASCFAYNTPITLRDGRKKPVQDITYNDILLVWDFENGCYSSAKPLWIMKKQVIDYYYHLVFSDGKALDLIGPKDRVHRIYCLDTNRFEYADRCVGKSIITEGGIVTLVSCDVISDTVEYYNIITDYHMNLYAGGVLTSTGLSNIYPVENMRYVKEERTLIPIDALDNCPEKYYYGMRLGEQVNYTLERLNEKIRRLMSLEVEHR